MRVEKVSVSMECKNTENYNSNKHSICLTAVLESDDNLVDVEKRLYELCKAYLEDAKALDRRPKIVQESAEPPQPQKPPKPRIVEANKNEPVEELIKKHNIRSLSYAGYLRSQGILTYKEWKAVHEYLSTKEIEERERLDNIRFDEAVGK